MDLRRDLVQAVKFDPANVPLTADKRLRVGTEKSDASKVQFYSHDWGDKTTWFEEAVRIVDGVGTDIGDHLTYNFSHTFFIDTYHAKITGEDFLKDSEGNSYRVVVKVDGVEKTEQDPHYGTGGDYTVDYAAGSITFLAAQDPGAVVTATYYYAASSLFTIKPQAGKKLLLEMVEVQFSQGIDLRDSVVFQAYGYVDIFAPQLLDTADPPGPYPSGTQIPLGDPIVYKSMRDYMNDAQRSYPSYPALGGSSWRGIQSPSYILDWDYLRGTLLVSSWGMEIRVYLAHDTPFTGGFATATFYCSSEDE